jgi:hypothetical protein
MTCPAISIASAQPDEKNLETAGYMEAPAAARLF